MRFFCVIVAVGVMLGLEGKAQTNLAGGIEAIVHGSIITSYQVARDAERFLGQLMLQYRNDPAAQAREYEKIYREQLEVLLENQLILREFASAGYNLPETVIDEQLRTYIRDQYPDRILFIKSLQAQGRTLEQFRKEFRERFIIEQMRIMRNTGDAIISPHRIELYYQEHQDMFQVEEQVRSRILPLIKPSGDSGQTRKLAGEILGKIRSDGVAFADMASVYSAGGRNAGALREWEAVSVLRKELAQAVAELKLGQVSDVIDTPDACYLVQLEERRPGQVRPLNEVRDQIEQTLLAQERTRLQKQWVDRLKKKTFVRYF